LWIFGIDVDLVKICCIKTLFILNTEFVDAPLKTVASIRDSLTLIQKLWDSNLDFFDYKAILLPKVKRPIEYSPSQGVHSLLTNSEKYAGSYNRSDICNHEYDYKGL
jgi:hypothetical protein